MRGEASLLGDFVPEPLLLLRNKTLAFWQSNTVRLFRLSAAGRREKGTFEQVRNCLKINFTSFVQDFCG